MEINIKDGYKVTEVGVIPDDWEVKKVGDICDFIVPGRNKPKKFEGDIPWITTPDLKDSRSVSQSRLGLCISIDEAKNVGSKIVPSGSVLMSCAGELGIVAFTEKEIVINQQLHAFIPSSIIDGWFLLNVIKSQKKYIDSVATKTAVPYINKDNCNSIPIPLPPLAEQKAIAHALSDVDNLITAIDQLIIKKRNIKQGTMQQLLTGKKRLPGFSGEWEVKKLGDECELITKGTTPTSLGKEFKNDGINFIKAESLEENGYVIKDKIAFIDHETHSLLKRSQLQENDILVSIAGVLGRIAIVKKEIIPANTNQALAIVRLKESAKLIHGYIFYYLKSSLIKKQIASINVQAAQANLSLENINNLIIAIPPLFEQKAISEILNDIDKEIEALEKNRDKYKTIKQGMMQELLTGKTRIIDN